MFRTAILAALAPEVAGHGYMLDPAPRGACKFATLSPNLSALIVVACASQPRAAPSPSRETSRAAPGPAPRVSASGSPRCVRPLVSRLPSQNAVLPTQGCTIGCKECGGSDGNAYCGNASDYDRRATLPESHWSYPYEAIAYTKPPCPSKDPGCAVARKKTCGANPFCAPGSAPVFNPCGVAGGDVQPGAPGNGGNPPAGYKQGDDARLIPELPSPKKVWKKGSHVCVQRRSAPAMCHQRSSDANRRCRQQCQLGGHRQPRGRLSVPPLPQDQGLRGHGGVLPAVSPGTVCPRHPT